MVRAGRLGESVPPTGSPNLPHFHALTGVPGVRNRNCLEPDLHRPADLDRDGRLPGPERPVLRPRRRAPRDPQRPRGQGPRRLHRPARCSTPCRQWAREHREYGFWGGESEEERAAAGYRVDMPVGRVARYPKGNGTPVEPRTPRVA